MSYREKAATEEKILFFSFNLPIVEDTQMFGAQVAKHLSVRPEVNPIERFWQFLKNQLSWNLFSSLDSLQEKVANLLNSISDQVIQSLTGWDYLLDALSLAGF